MAQQLQLIYDGMIAAKDAAKRIKAEYKDSLSHDSEYQKLVEEGRELRERKKLIELNHQERLGKQWETLEETQEDLKTSKEMLSDKAMTDLMNGETVSVRDDNGNQYEPVWSVRFRRIH